MYKHIKIITCTFIFLTNLLSMMILTYIDNLQQNLISQLKNNNQIMHTSKNKNVCKFINYCSKLLEIKCDRIRK